MGSFGFVTRGRDCPRGCLLGTGAPDHGVLIAALKFAGVHPCNLVAPACREEYHADECRKARGHMLDFVERAPDVANLLACQYAIARDAAASCHALHNRRNKLLVPKLPPSKGRAQMADLYVGHARVDLRDLF